MFEKKSICFLADRHALYDDRIYWKMAVPLEKLGFKVHYLLVGGLFLAVTSAFLPQNYL